MSKRDELRKKRRQQEQRQRFILIGVVALIAIGVVAVLVIPNFTPVGAVVTVTPNPRPQAQGLSMGNPNAPVKVVEYADFQCPYCKEYAQQLEPQIDKNYVETGKVYFTYVPYSFIGPESFAAAEAAYCANDQGKFWEYHDILFANQQSENSGAFSNKRLIAFASAIGLDTSKFQSCLNSQKYKDQVNQDIVKGNQAGVSATPSFVVNGKLVGMDQLEATIQQDLASAAK